MPTTPRPFKAIAAMSKNRVIGRGNAIPWHLPEDFRWFKRMTVGHTLVMGRRTFESIGKPLPRRRTIVLTRGGTEITGVRIVRDLREIDPKDEPGEVFICGGAQVYAEALPLCSDLYLTVVQKTVDGDTFFPVFEDQFFLAECVLDRPEFQILHYKAHDSGPSSI